MIMVHWISMWSRYYRCKIYVLTYQYYLKALRVRMYYPVFNHLIACITKPAVNPNRIQNGATLTNDLLVRQTCNHFIMAQCDRAWRRGLGGEAVKISSTWLFLRRWVVRFNLCDRSLAHWISWYANKQRSAQYNFTIALINDLLIHKLRRMCNAQICFLLSNKSTINELHYLKSRVILREHKREISNFVQSYKSQRSSSLFSNMIKK